ncbi:MAG: hypothetical protein HYW57_00470 [Ignavibacteriales bacterium]|nr:hypothetical protein [Ignavibacteriales bacterium]
MSVYQESKGSPILKAVIVVLFGILVYVLYEPYQIREQEEMFKSESRARMINIRAGQLMYISENGKYAPHIDTLLAFIRARIDSGKVAPDTFKPLPTQEFTPESLRLAPKSGRPYMIVSVDTAVIKKYVVEDPDGYGSIGSLTDDSRVNKASWEE